jgi:hypothetical protein
MTSTGPALVTAPHFGSGLSTTSSFQAHAGTTSRQSGGLKPPSRSSATLRS